MKEERLFNKRRSYNSIERSVIVKQMVKWTSLEQASNSQQGVVKELKRTSGYEKFSKSSKEFIEALEET